LQALVQECDAALALPGGPGTLTEIALAWNLMIIGAMRRRPLVLVGNGWQSVFDQLFTELDMYTPARQRDLLLFAKDVQTAVDMIEK
jgi:predicted Rossmann-fold nucleotide-binding protein